MPIKYIPYYPDTVEGQAILDNITRTRRILSYRENDKAFLKKKNFISNEFLKQNNDKFGYNRFDFLYLSDADKIENNISKLNEKISDFFKE
ncbi:MAG: hypothetical protein Q7J16_05155 [Candidatus Cloacimonadales bacterium]|nr:hypothetical protein [Candidatus Cloacimonadales bacterium]